MSRKKKHHDQDEPLHIPVHDEDAAAEEPQAPAGEVEASASPEPADEKDKLRAERDELYDRLQRLAADYQNYQKRSVKEAAQGREFANEALMKELLGVLDDMERALEAAGDRPEDDPLRVGMQLVHDKALAVLGRFGLTPIVAVGQPFDPERHSAMMQEPSEEVEPMTVLRELQRGYELKGRTLRPAAVIVSKAPEEE